MNKDNVRKYISDIQIAMGKILEEMDGLEEVAKEFSSNSPSNSLEASIPEEERNTISYILKNTTPKVEVVELSEEEQMEQIAIDCGIIVNGEYNFENIGDIEKVVSEEFKD